MEAVAKWTLSKPGNGEWRWMAARTDGAEDVSPCAFASVEDCMADAAQHGVDDYRATEAAYA